VPYAVIHNFVDPPRSAPPEQLWADLVTTGSLEGVKNHSFLLHVLAEAKRAGRTLTLDVFGDGPLRHDLPSEARALGVDGQVRFRGFRTDVRNFLPGYRAYVHASYSESLPLAIIEAMAAGLPIVAGKIAGIAELVDEGVEGRFWNLDDPAAAARTLIGLLDSEPERLRAGAAARARFSRDFDVEVVAPRLLSFLTETPRLGPSFRTPIQARDAAVPMTAAR
jgi:glycosyltransferase involved in cell wall biosynthesis